MSLTIKLSDGAFTASKALSSQTLPSRDHLAGEYVFGTDKPSSVKNLANRALPLLEVGAVNSLAITTAGSGGTNGTFALGFSGGLGVGGVQATGTFTVTGGVVTGTSLTTKGGPYLSAPTISTSASTGLVGASITPTMIVPTYGSNFITTQSGAGGFGFDTQLIPKSDNTIIIVRGPLGLVGGGSGVNIVGSVSGGAIFGIAEAFGNGRVQNGMIDLAHGAVLPQVSSGIVFHVGVSPVRDLCTSYFPATPGATLTPTVSATATSATGGWGRVYIGTSIFTSSQPWGCNIYYLAIYNRKLSATELQAAYVSIRAFLALRGVAI